MPFTRTDLETRGVCRFPQDHASVLCDNDSLRLSVWNNREYLFVQAILWKVSEHTLGKTEDNRDTGNHSDLVIAVGAAEGKRSFGPDRSYSLNPWPHLPGAELPGFFERKCNHGFEERLQGTRVYPLRGDPGSAAGTSRQLPHSVVRDFQIPWRSGGAMLLGLFA